MWPVINLIPLIGWNCNIQTERIFQPMGGLESNRSHVYNPAYNQILQLKATMMENSKDLYLFYIFLRPCLNLNIPKFASFMLVITK